MKNSLHAQDFEGKVAFFDIDGVLAPFRFNGHVRHYDPPMGVNAEELESGIFLKREPCKHMQDIVNSINTRRNIVVTGYIEERDGIKSDRERHDKRLWIAQHYPEVSDIIFVKYGDNKADYILNYCRGRGIDLKNTIFVGDEIHYLAEAEHWGIPSWHTSSLMDFFKEESL